jgi:hypothetical protein
VCFGPGAVEEGVLCVEPVALMLAAEACDGAIAGWVLVFRKAYHFSATIPFAVKPSMYSLPFPTRPKFADAATAMRESKKGEYLTP